MNKVSECQVVFENLPIFKKSGLFGGMLTQDIAAWKMKSVKLFKLTSYYTQYLKKSKHYYLNTIDKFRGGHQ